MIELAPLLRLGLLVVRPGALLLASPIFGGTYAPAPVKVGLIALIALALMPSTGVPETGSEIALVGVIAREAAIGLALALAIRVLIAAAELGGQLTSFQIGLSYSATVDPQSGVRNNVVATIYSNITVVTLFLTNGHHAFLRALRASYEALPIGPGSVHDSLGPAVVTMLGLIFSFGARLAAPIVIVLVVTEVVMALVARSAPAFNLMALGAPVRLLVGLILLALVAPAASGLIAGMSQSVLQLGVHTAEAFR